jgi:hypothetical protein
MDHLPIPPSNTAYSTYQEEHKNRMDKGTSTSLRLTQNSLARKVVLANPDFLVPFEIYTDASK